MPHRIGVAVLATLVFTACSSGGTTGKPGTPGHSTVTGVTLNEDFVAAGAQVFPADNWWNLDVTGAPVDPGSASFIASIGTARGLHPDFGAPPYGIPYVTVSGSQALLQVDFVSWPEESDAGAPGRPAGYPIPEEARTQSGYIEGGEAGGGSSGDRHLLVIDRDRWLLFETGGTRWNSDHWEADCGAVFDLASNARRTDGWTSVDAAGLAIFPGLVRYDEVYGPDEITHAFRFTLGGVSGHVWPASHDADTGGSLPLGARLRLKASVSITGYPAPMQKIFRAMKKYGLILADTGTSMYISGTMDARWDNEILNPAFAGIKAGDFEVVQLGWGAP